MIKLISSTSISIIHQRDLILVGENTMLVEEINLIIDPGPANPARSTLVPPNGELTFVLSVNPGFTVGDIHEMIVANNG
jgi:hypothetical protein